MGRHQIHQSFLGYIHSQQNTVVIPNYYWKRFEMDVFVITISGLVVEYEIKISKADYRNDFTKSYVDYSIDNKPERFKHDLIKKGLHCNRFYFVTPENIIDKSEIPSYAGLIRPNEFGWFSVVKTAPLLHHGKVEDSEYKSICHSLCFREKELRLKLNRKKESVNG